MNTRTYLEPEREINVYGSFDVVVVGGGCAGITAAVAASRNGAKTLLIERFGYLGGTATASMMANINAFRNQKKPDSLQTSRGIAEEIIMEMHKAGGLGRSAYEQVEYQVENGDLAYSYAIDPEVFKYVTLRLVVEADVKVLLHTYFADVIMEGSQIRGIIVENKSGRSAIYGKTIIDASGDADVAFRAGVPFWQVKHDEKFRMEDQLMYRITGFPMSTDAGPVKGSIANGCMTVWGPAAPMLCGTDADDLTEEEIITRLNIYEHFEDLKRNDPVLKDAVLVGTGPLIGVRQTRFIEGDYTLTADDVLSGRRFEDTIALCSSPIIRFYGYRRYLEHEGYDIPYRCLLPKGVEGMLVAGRCISSDQASYESYRAMAPIMSIGEAAGVAAAIAVSEGVYPRHVNVKGVQETLIHQGAELGQNRSK